MADNIRLNTGSGGDLLAARDASGVKHQKVVTEFIDGSSIIQVASDAPFPVVDSAAASVLTDIAEAVANIPVNPPSLTETQPVGLSTAVLFDVSGNPLNFKFASIDVVSSGNNAIVSAVAGMTIRVLSVCLFPTAAVDVYFNDGTANLLGGTRKIKLDNSGAAGDRQTVLPFSPSGWFQTAAANRPINLNLSASVGVAGCLVYVEV